ncbi:acetoacetate--CoA ligase [Streptomyces sp. NWU339]|uniref:acetoacetate--CoA ligase n=1 Tax=Streptomyces sp. NWU339 TaxID=2185284 RepID=UPI000D684AAD|nr:acetoacetate--CoA ligase [Streptomyces sp. NWU339]PWI08825.1 acetoacetate--CoA ligase [Streptomyces sp. NWU339]
MTGPTGLELDASALGGFCRWLRKNRGLDLSDYGELHRWSVTDLSGFWSAVQQYLDVPFRTAYREVLAEERMPGARWFPGVRTNYADGLLTGGDPQEPALITVREDGSTEPLTTGEFRRRVAALARSLTSLGVGVGDRVVGYLPNIGESAVAFYAAASIGAVWASVGSDYGPDAAAARLGQLTPKVLIAVDGYRYAGVDRDCGPAVATLREAIGPAHTVIVPRLGSTVAPDCLDWRELTAGEATLEPVAVPFDHPLWVLFSSGTTGVPKGIVHSHGGVQLEMYKTLRLQWDLGLGSRLLWATSPSWVIWTLLVSAPLVGATAVLYDGSPTFPDTAGLWRAASAHRVTHFGTSPGFLAACERSGIFPGRLCDLSALRQIIATGSPVPPSANVWVSAHVGGQVPLIAISGGTDVVGAFVGGAPTVPVVPGEISAPCLGVKVEAWDPQGRTLVNEVGELVVTHPMPSMPVALWGDESGERYRQAYFDTYPGTWRHGDWITVTDRNSVVIHGRSDATLNRNGVRMGSADIYAAVEDLPEVHEALVIGAELPEGGYWMPLFVALRDGVELDDSLRDRIRQAIRQQASPRHVPDEIVAVPAIPHTKTGKKLEVPLKRILLGAEPGAVIAPAAVDAPEALDFFVRLAERRSARA